ncbi:hypothetical protein ASF18_09365 [Methylobacterium sp. Leaf89]|nr:cation:dicarboxylase symporter family transporter [Methylobacterium sp. Leaf89]KQO66922.1 hypothetical protein ASF18_09365 [Methylobacterium sp. Leaf89]
MIKMIVAPLVLSRLVAGIAHRGDTASVGRVGGRAMLWFVGASLFSLLLGLVMVLILRPGEGRSATNVLRNSVATVAVAK